MSPFFAKPHVHIQEGSTNTVLLGKDAITFTEKDWLLARIILLVMGGESFFKYWKL